MAEKQQPSFLTTRTGEVAFIFFQLMLVELIDPQPRAKRINVWNLS